jgi:hypothetical protein
VRGGIPPQLLPPLSVAPLARLELVGSIAPFRSNPLRFGVSVLTHAPHGRAESPLPSASLMGTRILATVEYRSR